jgi:hypothetical protein
MKLKFNRGKPPHVGWWCSGEFGADGERFWRWWDGESWSLSAFEDMYPGEAAIAASMKNGSWQHIKWSNYYPENARVKRVSP